MKETKLKKIFELVDYFKPILLKEENEIDQLGLEFIEKLKEIGEGFENIKKYNDDILLNFNLITFNLEMTQKFENKLIIYDLLIFKHILTKIFTNDVNIYTIRGILKMNKEPNYNILSKIFSKSENGSEKIKLENILDLVFGKSTNDAMKTILLCEYLLQREINFKKLIINLIKVKLILWLVEFEPKTIKWYLELFEDSKEPFEKLEIFR